MLASRSKVNLGRNRRVSCGAARLPAPDAETRPLQGVQPPLLPVYRALLRAFGPQGWWPARTKFEMMVGAILTQNTAWTNVEKALRALRREKLLSPGELHRVPHARLAGLIKPAGYYNLKAHRLKHFAAWLMMEYGGNIPRMFREDAATLRHKLLAVHGIGKETADSILLYAGYHPVFVVDAYTRRFMSRHGWLNEKAAYDDVARIFEQGLKNVPAKDRVAIYNEYHALIVELAKRHCRAKPDCTDCPLKKWLP